MKKQPGSAKKQPGCSKKPPRKPGRKKKRANAASKPQAEKAPLTANLQEVAAFHAALAAAVPDAELASTSLVADRSGHVVVQITCPARESICAGTVTLRTLDAVIAGTGAGAGEEPSARAAILTLAKGSFTIAGGGSKKLTLRLSAKGAHAARAHPCAARPRDDRRA